MLVGLIAVLLNPLVQGKAASLLGNSPIGGSAFNFVADGGLAGGGAVAFTPTRDFSFSSITVWLTGYTGLDMYGQKNQGFYAGIYADQPAVDTGYGSDQPGMLLANLSCPQPNNGSQAAFDFANLSPDLVLQANTKYWLFIYEKTAGSFNYDSCPQWVAGSSPTGDGVVYDGSQNFWAYDFSSTSATPAFSINNVNPVANAVDPVPEPSSVWMLGIGMLIWICFRYRKLVSPRPVLAREKSIIKSHQ